MKNIKLLATDCDGVLTDGGLYYLENGQCAKRFNVLDGMGFELLHQNGIVTAIITGDNNKLLTFRAKKLNTDHLIMDETDKIVALQTLCEKLNIAISECAYIGDDVNDLNVLKSCGYGFAPPNAHHSVLNSGAFITKATGGNGCFREVADWIIENNKTAKAE
jgi:YrbI family 3-deoxy-D-manno-octulosonate 8-phosphate phosphatase